MGKLCHLRPRPQLRTNAPTCAPAAPSILWRLSEPIRAVRTRDFSLPSQERRAAIVKRRYRVFRLLVLLWAFCAAAECALAGISGPLSFNFATGFLSNIFLLPFKLAGCS